MSSSRTIKGCVVRDEKNHRHQVEEGLIWWKPGAKNVLNMDFNRFPSGGSLACSSVLNHSDLTPSWPHASYSTPSQSAAEVTQSTRESQRPMQTSQRVCNILKQSQQNLKFPLQTYWLQAEKKNKNKTWIIYLFPS